MGKFGDVNMSILIGRLGDNPDVRFTPGGAVLANFSVATTHGFKKGEQWENVTTWHRCLAWNKQAEFAQKFLKKGLRVFVQGRIENYTWESNGEKKYGSRIVVNDVQLLDHHDQAGAPAGQGSGAENPVKPLDGYEGSGEPPAAEPNPDDVPF